ncbi:hypothetical protein [Winogradskyella thalassocola]|nr:hypothetical protein [Winogradskyella thalassocola]
MQDLLSTIKNPMIFYLPAGLFKSLKPQHIDELENIGLLNTLFYTDNNGEYKKLTNGVEYLELLGKSKILQSNIFELLDLKSRLDKDAFHYLLDEYFKDLDSQIMLTDMISKEAKDTTINYKHEIQGYLDLQYNQLTVHKEEIQIKFGSWKNKFELDRILNRYRTKVSIPTPEITKTPISISNTTAIDNKPEKPKQTKKKRTLPSDTEIDHYLLETVFGVEISNKNNKKR